MTVAMTARPRIRPAAALALLTLALASQAVLASRAQARPPQRSEGPVSLREALTGSTAQDGRTHAHTPLVARYLSNDGDRFVLDRTGSYALLRFERSDEVWALRSAPAPGGDVLYKNDVGEPVLRATRLGGVTLFTDHSPDGEPAEMIGPAPPSRPPHVAPAALPGIVQASMLRVGRSTGLTGFKLRVEGDGEPYVFADAVNLVTDTLVRMWQTPALRRYVSRVRAVWIHPSGRMDARVRGGLLEIGVSAREGVGGRPSSGRIERAIIEAR